MYRADDVTNSVEKLRNLVLTGGYITRLKDDKNFELFVVHPLVRAGAGKYYNNLVSITDKQLIDILGNDLQLKVLSKEIWIVKRIDKPEKGRDDYFNDLIVLSAKEKVKLVEQLQHAIKIIKSIPRKDYQRLNLVEAELNDFLSKCDIIIE